MRTDEDLLEVTASCRSVRLQQLRVHALASKMSSVIVHFLNLTEHWTATANMSRHLLAEFGHIPFLSSAAFYFTTGQEPCEFIQGEIFAENRSRHSYQNFDPLRSIVIFLGHISEKKDIEYQMRSCYPWIGVLCSSRIKRKETLKCCDAFYSHGRIGHFEMGKDPFGEEVILFGAKQVCNRCGPWLNISKEIVEVTSKNTNVHIRVPRTEWVFHPREDHSVPFPQVKRERDLPYCNQILKVFSERFNMSFRFQATRHEFYGQSFTQRLVGPRLIPSHAWDGGLNSILRRQSLFAIGAVTLYASREQFFSSSNVFSIEDILLLNRVRRSPSSGRFVLDNVQPAVVYLYVLAAIACSVLVHRTRSSNSSNFSGVLLALTLLPLASTARVPGAKVCIVLAILRLTVIVLTTHLSANILDQMMTSKVRFAYKDVIEASGHLRPYPQTRLWGYSHIIDSVKIGLNSIKNRKDGLSPQDEALCKLLDHRSDFGNRPENSKITVYAGGSENDFIMDEQSAAAYHLSRRARAHGHTYINAITGLNNMYETVILQKGCAAGKNLSMILRRLDESGHIKYWRRCEIRTHRNGLRYKVLSMESFHVTFYRQIYAQVILGSAAVLIELAVHTCRSEF